MSVDADKERARLKALEDLKVLDTLEEIAYDDLVRLAAELCDAPIALISLIDQERQWFKARIGLQVRETPRQYAFCAHAIQDPGRVLVVDDATQDERFAANPLVTGDPGIRFYAGVPLVTPAGHALGTLCVIDREPRRIEAGKIETLQFLARQVVQKLEERRARLDSSALDRAQRDDA